MESTSAECYFQRLLIIATDLVTVFHVLKIISQEKRDLSVQRRLLCARGVVSPPEVIQIHLLIIHCVIKLTTERKADCGRFMKV